MKQKILSLITIVLFGTSVVYAQTNDQQGMAKVCPEMHWDKTACSGDSAQCRHMKAHPHGKPHFGKDTDKRHFGMKHGRRFGKKQMRRHHGSGMRPFIPQIKSTPKCKCATCVELSKQEDLQSKIDSMRKETYKLQHRLDSLRGLVPQKGVMPTENKRHVSKK